MRVGYRDSIHRPIATIVLAGVVGIIVSTHPRGLHRGILRHVPKVHEHAQLKFCCANFSTTEKSLRIAQTPASERVLVRPVGVLHQDRHEAVYRVGGL